jgi:esterase/lipase
MTQDEIFRMQGELSVLKKELEELEISGSNSLIIINNMLNPLNIDNSIAELEINKANVEMRHLTEIWSEIKEIKNKAGKISDSLNKIKKSIL